MVQQHVCRVFIVLISATLNQNNNDFSIGEKCYNDNM